MIGDAKPFLAEDYAPKGKTVDQIRLAAVDAALKDEAFTTVIKAIAATRAGTGEGRRRHQGIRRGRGRPWALPLDARTPTSPAADRGGGGGARGTSGVDRQLRGTPSYAREARRAAGRRVGKGYVTGVPGGTLGG